MDAEYFSIDSSEEDYQHSYGESASLLLSVDGLQFRKTFYDDAECYEFSSQNECMISFSGIQFSINPDEDKNYSAYLNINNAGNLVLSGTGWTGSASTTPFIVAPGCYKATQSGTTLTINSTGNIKRSSSSKKLKKDISNELDINVEALYNVEVVQFKYKEGVLDSDDEWYGKDVLGLIAEQVNEVFPQGVVHSGESFEICDDWNARTIIPAMLKLVQDQKREIDEIKSLIQ